MENGGRDLGQAGRAERSDDGDSPLLSRQATQCDHHEVVGLAVAVLGLIEGAFALALIPGWCLLDLVFTRFFFFSFCGVLLGARLSRVGEIVPLRCPRGQANSGSRPRPTSCTLQFRERHDRSGGPSHAA